MAPTKEQIDAGINAYEDEKCRDLETIGRIAKERGWQCGGNAPIPALLPDGSLAQPELEVDDSEEPAESPEG